MQSKCEYSTLTIPNDPAYAQAAAGYIIEIAKIIGFVGQDLDAISEGVRRALFAQMQYSFEPGEKAVIEISCERIVEGLKIVLKDKGIPFDDSAVYAKNQTPQPPSASSFGFKILGLKEYLHEVLLHNLGSRGKEIVLVKQLKNKNITDYYAACELDPYEETAIQTQADPKQRQCTVRRMKPEEAVEVSKSIYKTYGYTYPHDFIYYPEKIADPLTPHFCTQFEKLGFFFGGVLPGSLQDGDALIMQYLNNVLVDYDAIQLESDIANKILDHIRAHDPNQFW